MIATNEKTAKSGVLYMKYETEEGMFEDLFEIDEDADEVGAAFLRGEDTANSEMVESWNDSDY
jgi:hypothetical protein